MEWFSQIYSEAQLIVAEESLSYWFFGLSLVFLAGEALRLKLKGRLKWDVLGDMAANFTTLFGLLGISLLYWPLYVGAFYVCYEYLAITKIPMTGWSILLCILLADLAYYWEHRFMHRVGIGWATHTVHHSSPYFNISVAYRFGPLDGIIPIFFHLPLALMGFNPVMILFAEIVVQLYQTALHTETIGKLPKPIEAILNTPSHHRVHHGSNPEYLDKNYGGILIIWDRMFGSFAEEKAKVEYGITEPVESINPMVVFFHGLTRLGRAMLSADSLRQALAIFFKPPEWKPGN